MDLLSLAVPWRQIKGKHVSEAIKLSNKAVIEALEGLPPQKIHCSVLAEQAIKAALVNFYDEKGLDGEAYVGKLMTEEEIEATNIIED